MAQPKNQPVPVSGSELIPAWFSRWENSSLTPNSALSASLRVPEDPQSPPILLNLLQRSDRIVHTKELVVLRQHLNQSGFLFAKDLTQRQYLFYTSVTSSTAIEGVHVVLPESVQPPAKLTETTLRDREEFYGSRR